MKTNFSRSALTNVVYLVFFPDLGDLKLGGFTIDACQSMVALMDVSFLSKKKEGSPTLLSYA